MPLLFQDHITRADIRKNPDHLYVFGDNLLRRGCGGLAKQCRGELNTVGIPTKKRPSMDERAFFLDADLEMWLNITWPTWAMLEETLFQSKTIVFPSHGIGTGLARLPEKAPAIMNAIEENMAILREISSRRPQRIDIKIISKRRP